MDFLSDILKTINLSSAVYFEKSFFGRWGMKMGQSPYGQFHAVTRGSCYLSFKNSDEKILLSSGDIILLPFGAPHTLSESLKMENVVDGQSVYQAHIEGNDIFTDGNEKTALICGHFEFDKCFIHPFLESLPAFIHIKESDPKGKQLMIYTQEIAYETTRQSSGSSLVIGKLAEILFIQIIRNYAINLEDENSFLSSLNDSKISKVLDMIHQFPERDWNVDTLSKESGLSRTSFINKFNKTVGQTPIQYLSHWRLNKAKKLIQNTPLSLSKIGEKIGYNSEVAFSRAFKKRFNISPGKFRSKN